MPPDFTASLATRLDRLNAPKVMEAADRAPIEPGCVYIAPGGRTHLYVENKGRLQCRVKPADPVNAHAPSPDGAGV